jgi:hypothetical protein
MAPAIHGQIPGDLAQKVDKFRVERPEIAPHAHFTPLKDAFSVSSDQETVHIWAFFNRVRPAAPGICTPFAA